MNNTIYVCITFLLISFLGKAQNDSDWVYTEYTYDNGQISSKGYLHDGKPDGYWKSYYRTGIIKTEGNRKNFLLDSVWKFYGSDGILSMSITYDEDLKDGERVTYSDGKVVKVENYEADVKNGLTTLYFPNGNIKKEVPFVNGKEQGDGFGFDERENINTLLTYKAGVLVKELVINKVDKQDRKQGYWITFFKDTRKINVTGTYLDDLKHGYWKYYAPNGNLLRIEKWIHGVLQENSEETEKLEVRKIINPRTGKIAETGPYRNGIKEGIHREYDDNGNVINSKQYSKGILLAEGIFDDMGRRQKTWKYYYETGELKAQGDFKDDLKVRTWKYFFIDGTVEQTGAYTKDKPEGSWVWYYPDKSIRKEEEYVFGLEDGPYVEYSDSGTVVAQGEYIEGLKEGNWKYVYGNISIEGKYFEGDKTGRWVSTYTDNDKKAFEGSYEVGVEEGKHIYYHPNGLVKRRGYYQAGKKDGIWEFFTESGVLALTIEYENGKEIKYNGVKISYGRRVDRELEAEEAGD
ncbi:MAG: toxin-antitoxin system YwqK family antitoxin [Schleiferiaceae bacterium]